MVQMDVSGLPALETDEDDAFCVLKTVNERFGLALEYITEHGEVDFFRLLRQGLARQEGFQGRMRNRQAAGP